MADCKGPKGRGRGDDAGADAWPGEVGELLNGCGGDWGCKLMDRKERGVGESRERLEFRGERPLVFRVGEFFVRNK